MLILFLKIIRVTGWAIKNVDTEIYKYIIQGNNLLILTIMINMFIHIILERITVKLVEQLLMLLLRFINI